MNLKRRNKHLDSYLQEISKTPLLSPEQELSIAGRMSFIRNNLGYARKLLVSKDIRLGIYFSENHMGRELSLENYLKNVKEQHSSRLSKETFDFVSEKINLLRNEYKELVNSLVSANLRFVVSVARKYRGSGLPFLDLIQEGNLGLTKAADRFDEKKGFKFISYAFWWIRQSMLTVIETQQRTVRLPISVVRDINRERKITRKLEQGYEREPTHQEILDEIGFVGNITLDVRMFDRPDFSLDSKLFEKEGEETLLDVTPNNTPSPDGGIIQESFARMLESVLSTLPERERIVIESYFGIGTIDEKTLEEIGFDLNLTRERVRQIKEIALGRLRKGSRGELLESYF